MKIAYTVSIPLSWRGWSHRIVKTLMQYCKNNTLVYLFLGSPGLTCHPSRPFTMASCSRDSTVRLWSLTPLITPLLVNILTEHSWDGIIGNTGQHACYVLNMDVIVLLSVCLCSNNACFRLCRLNWCLCEAYVRCRFFTK